jgi:hypothetical protein
LRSPAKIPGMFAMSLLGGTFSACSPSSAFTSVVILNRPRLRRFNDRALTALHPVPSLHYLAGGESGEIRARCGLAHM